MMNFKSLISAVLLLLAASVQPGHAKCGRMIRAVSWNGRQSGSYGAKQLANDFSPINYFRGEQNARITSMGGTEYLAVTLKKGCYGTDSKKGCGVYGRAPMLGAGKTVTMEYTMRFSRNFDWVRGGKLPGLCAGDCPTGCEKNISPSDGFSARIMWTDNECQGKPKGCKKGSSGGMHIYAYYSNMKGHKGCGDEYTFMSGGKAIVIYPNKDYKIRLVVKMNTGNNANGFMKAYLNGKMVAHQNGMRLGTNGMKVDSMMFESFYGGSSDMAAHKNENLFFKDMYMWQGDCGSTSGSKKIGNGKKQRSSLGFSGGSGGWKAHTVDPGSFKKNAMKTKNLSIDTIFNGGFCASFNSVNEGKSTCKDFTVELNLNPQMLSLQKHTSSLRMITQNNSKGYFHLGRSSGLNRETAPGASRKGQFCALTKEKAIFTEASLAAAMSVNSLCNGEGKANKSLKAVTP